MDLFGESAFDAFDYNESNDIITFPTIPSDTYKYSPAIQATNSPALAMSRTTSSSTNMGTISPQELSLRDITFSAPSSTAFTNLTSPSAYNESPNYLDDSPMFGGDALAQDANWFPLFPEDQVIQQPLNLVDPVPELQPVILDASPLLQVEDLNDVDQLELADALRDQRRRSSCSPQMGNKASSTSGVGARRRNQPLPPIIVEDKNDTVAMKRARNTLAARKSRQKKMESFDRLQEELARMTEERDLWKARALARG